MPVQLLINLFIAFLWMFLHDAWNAITFLTGFLVGLAILFGFRRFFPTGFYMKTVIAVLKLLFIFIQELISSGILVIRQITRRELKILPGIFSVDTDLEGDWEITLLSLLITLTPGSVVMEISPNGKTLYIHAIDIPEAKAVVIKVKERFEKAIKDVTR